MTSIHYIEIILYTILMFYVGIGLGWVLRERKARKNIEHFQHNLDNLTKSYEEFEKKLIKVVATISQDQILIHDAVTHKFLVQGSSFEEIEKKLKSQYPDDIFMIIDNDNLREDDKL